MISLYPYIALYHIMFNEDLIGDTNASLSIAATDPDYAGCWPGHGTRASESRSRRQSPDVTRQRSSRSCWRNESRIIFRWFWLGNQIILDSSFLYMMDTYEWYQSIIIRYSFLLEKNDKISFAYVGEWRLNHFHFSINFLRPITDYQSWYDSVSCLLLLFLLHCSRMKGDLQRTVCYWLSRWNLFDTSRNVVIVVSTFI